MTKSVNNSFETLYSVLECKESATYDELKQNYQRLIREYHPDKQYNQSYDKFVKIDNAWKVLRNQETRNKYDASIFQDNINDNSLIYAELHKSELNFDHENSFSYPCRCGSNFVIKKEYLGEEECVIECSECSNCIIIR